MKKFFICSACKRKWIRIDYQDIFCPFCNIEGRHYKDHKAGDLFYINGTIEELQNLNLEERNEKSKY